MIATPCCMGCHRQCWNGYNEFRTVQPDSFVEERSMTTSLLYWKSCIGCQVKCPADLQTADDSVLRDAWPSTGISCWATGPAPLTSSVEVRFCRTILCAILADRQARWPPFLCGSGNSLESVAKLCLVGRICDIFWLRCALPERSMEICTKRVLGMQISKIAGNGTAFQSFPPKIGN